MADEKKENQVANQINIELTEEIAEGIYSNLAMIAHSNSEFVIDFIRLMPGVPKAKVKSRIVITPEHAKRLLAALKDNIEKYEKAFGPITQTGEMPRFPVNFGGTMGEA
jgi:actin-like ATPase involved in cell morphogenesis